MPLATFLKRKHSYDALSQLTGTTRAGSGRESFKIDANGNMVVANGASRTNNADNEMTDFGGTSLAYDNAGNLLTGPGLPNDEATAYGGDTSTTYVYDAWNRLVMVKDTAGDVVKMYTYDGLGRRITDSDGTTTDHYFSTASQDLETSDSNGNVTHNVFSPVYVNAIVASDTAGTRVYYTSDANYDVTAVINTSGSVLQRMVYDSYGSPFFLDSGWTQTNNNAQNVKFLWQGGWFDDKTNSYDFNARWYNPSLMRWLTADPIGYGDWMNYYRAMADNPINRTDPDISE